MSERAQGGCAYSREMECTLGRAMHEALQEAHPYVQHWYKSGWLVEALKAQPELAEDEGSGWTASYKVQVVRHLKVTRHAYSRVAREWHCRTAWLLRWEKLILQLASRLLGRKEHL
jgi:hypothetical protein